VIPRTSYAAIIEQAGNKQGKEIVKRQMVTKFKVHLLSDLRRSCDRAILAALLTETAVPPTARAVSFFGELQTWDDFHRATICSE
jgi:hypothetical protein